MSKEGAFKTSHSKTITTQKTTTTTWTTVMPSKIFHTRKLERPYYNFIRLAEHEGVYFSGWTVLHGLYVLWSETCLHAIYLLKICLRRLLFQCEYDNMPVRSWFSDMLHFCLYCTYWNEKVEWEQEVFKEVTYTHTRLACLLTEKENMAVYLRKCKQRNDIKIFGLCSSSCTYRKQIVGRRNM